VGGETSPKWIFVSAEKNEPLLGLSSKEKLGTMKVDDKPCSVSATFTVSGEDVWIYRGKVGLAEGKTLSASRWAQLERIIALSYIGKKLDMPISEMRWEYA
jgi:hypothetical protein